MLDWHNRCKGYPLEIASAHWKMSACFDCNWETLILFWSSSLIYSQQYIIVYKINHGKVLRNTRYAEQNTMIDVRDYAIATMIWSIWIKFCVGQLHSGVRDIFPNDGLMLNNFQCTLNTIMANIRNTFSIMETKDRSTWKQCSQNAKGVPFFAR